MENGGRDSPMIVAQIFSSGVIWWKSRLSYNTNAVSDTANDLNEYYTVDFMQPNYSVRRINGLSGCYDVNGIAARGCLSFLIYQILDDNTGCS